MIKALRGTLSKILLPCVSCSLVEPDLPHPDKKVLLVTEPHITTAIIKEDGDNLKLMCLLDGFYPNKLKVEWLEGTELVSHQPVTKISANEGENSYTAVSQLSIEEQPWNQGKEFTCKATHESKTVSKSSSKCTAHPSSGASLIRLEKPRLESVLTGSSVTASCIVYNAADTQVSWLENGQVKKKGTTEHRDAQTLVSNLTMSTERWNKLQTITCRAESPCVPKLEKTFNIIEPVQKTPTVLIRRILEDVSGGENVVLECVARDLPSGELAISLQAGGASILRVQYLNLPDGLQMICARFTLPSFLQTKSKRFICQVQMSQSQLWNSKLTADIFDDPSVDLLVVDSAGKSGSAEQKLLCSGTGMNPTISWLPNSVRNARSEKTMQDDGRVRVFSELQVPQQEWNKKVTFTCKVTDRKNPVQKSTSICDVTPVSSQLAQVYLLGPSLSDMRSAEVSVTCLLLGYKLKDFSITWKVGMESYQRATTDGPKDHANGTQSVRSTLKVTAAQWNAYKDVTCEVQHICSQNKQKQVISKTKNLKQPTVRIIQPSDEDLSPSEGATLLCLISGFHPAEIFVHWKLNQLKLDATQYTNSPMSSHSAGQDYFMYSALTLPESRSEGGTYSCIVSHQSSEEQIVQTTNNIYDSQRKSKPTVEVLQGHDKLVCLVSSYSPSAINITWLMNGGSVQHEHNTTSPAKGPDGKFSVKSSLHFSLSQWRPGATYTCSVKHVTGIENSSLAKTEDLRDVLFVDDNSPEGDAQDSPEETWNMACAFIGLFVVSLIYGCAVTLVKVKVA